MAKRLSEALNKYQEANGKREVGEIRSIFNVHIREKLLELLELKELRNRKLEYVLDHIPIAGFVVLTEPIFKDSLLQLPESRTLIVKKSKWNRFCTWLLEQDWYLSSPLLRESSVAETPLNTHIARGTAKKVAALKKKKEGKAKKFRLMESDWTPLLRAEFHAFEQFCTIVTAWRHKPIRKSTIDRYLEGVERILGFQKQQPAPAEQLSLQQLLDLSVLKAYEDWSRRRGTSSATIQGDVAAAVPIAQWVFHQLSPDANWHNPASVKVVRGYVKAVADLKDRPHASQEACDERAISMAQGWEILRYLNWRCKDLEEQQGVTKEVIDAWMDYLILAFLLTTGGRQRELRELTFGKLALENNGEIIVELPPEGHKTGSTTGKGRVYPLFVGPMQPELAADLLYYRDHVRPKNLGHDYAVFMRRNWSSGDKRTLRGDPIPDHHYLSHLVPRTVAVVTAHLYGIENAKWTAPHDFRRIIATWVCTYGTPAHLAIYAELLGHDINILTKIYNKMHPGKLARQASIAYRDIAANEARVKEWESPGSSQIALSAAQMNQSALIAMLKKLVKKLWNALTPRKRETVFESLSAAEREVLDE